MRRRFLKAIVGAGLWTMFARAASARAKFKIVAHEISALISMKHSAFPFRGQNPETGEDFLNVTDGQRKGHKSPRGGVHWEDETYSDRRSLHFVPAGFNLNKLAFLVVFFHGNEATLERDIINRQHVPLQLQSSGLNAVLAAPQLAVDVRDSSPGNFWKPGYFSQWLAEVDANLAKLYGQHAKPSDFSKLPIILVAYSGGYFPAAWCLKLGGAGGRIRGLILLDALYGDTEKFADWIQAQHKSTFTFSAYSKASRKWNLQLQETLQQNSIEASDVLPETLKRGLVTFIEVPGDVDHVEFMSQAWTKDPLQWVLQRIPQ